MTTPYTQSQHTWTLGYDPQGRVTSVTSPVSGTPGQAGYTPAYTTQFTYGVSQTVVVEGFGSSQPLTHTYTLDAQGNAPTLTDVAGQGHVRYAAFDVDHDVISGTDALGNTTLYTHTYVGPTGNIGLLTQEQQGPIRPYDPGSSPTPVITTYKYNATNDRVEEDKPEGGIIRYGYDGHHAVITTTETVTDTTQWRGTVDHYDQYGELTGTTDGRGVTVDANGVASLNGQWASYTTNVGYDGQGDETSESTPPITTTPPGGAPQANTPVTTTYGYDLDGNQTSMISANGNATGAPSAYTTTYSYDHLGRQVATTLPPVRLYDGRTTAPTQTTGYDGDGDVVRQTDALGQSTTSRYDPLGRLVSATNPVSGTELITYTATRESFDQDPTGAVTAYRYNSGGEVIWASDPVSGTTQYAYDGVGNTINITTSDGLTGQIIGQEVRRYDALNRVITDSVGGPNTVTATTQTAYDLDGNVYAVLHPQGDATCNGYDTADQLTWTVSAPGAPCNGPGATAHYYYYGNAGNQVYRLDSDGRSHTTTYDADDRVVQEVDTDPSGAPTLTTSTSYDPDGNIIGQTMQGGGQTSTYAATYNPADWLTSATRDGVRTSYGYDADGRERTETVLNDGVPITHVLDAAGRVTAIGEDQGGTGPYTSTFAYNPNDLPLTQTMPGPITATLGYDAASRLTHLGATGPAQGTPAQTLSSSYDYGYDAPGRTTAVTTTLNGSPVAQTLAHDALSRLTGAQGTDGTSQSWRYDNNGNLTQATITTTAGTTTTTYGYGGVPNELQTLTIGSLPTRYYGYDKNGDTTSISDGATLNTQLRYDSQARLSTVTLSNGTAVTMTYNAAGQRASYAVSTPGQPTLTERFQYRNGLLGQMAAVTGTTSYTDTYLYDPNGNPLELLRQQGGTTSRYWYELDGRNDVVALTSITGTVVDRYSYDLWGLPIASQTSETVPQPFRYAGYWWDKELGWYWVSVRSYDPEGRWLQPDPSEQDGVRTYVYVGDVGDVGDDPVDVTDPSRLFDSCNVPIIGLLCARNVATPEHKEQAQRPFILVTYVRGHAVPFVVLNGRLVRASLQDAELAAH